MFCIFLYPEYSSIFTLRFILISFVIVEIKFGIYIYIQHAYEYMVLHVTFLVSCVILSDLESWRST